jgi:AraC family ethanolamine operon transcriptional activator
MSEDSRVSIGVAPKAPLVRSLDTNDFDRISQAFVNWDHRFEQLGQGRFHGRIVFGDFGGVQLLDLEMNLVIRSRGARAPDTFTPSPVMESNAEAFWRGRVLRPGMINVVGPHHEMDHRTSRDYRHTAITVHRDLIERAASTLIGVDLDRLLGGNGAPIVERSRAEAMVVRWRAAMRSLIANGASGSPAVPLKVDAEGLVVDLLRALAAGRITDPFRTTPSDRRRVVREAEEYARIAPPEAVTVLRLCELTGVSERTLHYAFVEVTGLTPKAYLKTVRLNRARLALRSTAPGRRSIAEVARRHGFFRPGNFAADFRRLFGELPSEFQSSQTRRPARNMVR